MNSFFQYKKKGEISNIQNENFFNYNNDNKENIDPRKQMTSKKLSRTPLQDITNTFKFDNENLNGIIKELPNEYYSSKKDNQNSFLYMSTEKKSGKKTDFKMIR
jgi:hypothetical protein